ncbi:hypothetical protein MOQ_001089 [Trypanosoma cruzi marinkellei]|uniref:Uncharacterized protein n=1 Tax=Trypanosoma cruzi marinkellei TaxID=85056 RepID=K2MTX8_TRYCR|nr:hypothetical protein MOQ_001089 [Trypanosoma cruzi marinkellei]
MLRCCPFIFCAAASTDAIFRRAFGSQSILIDLIPVKKPMIEGSLSWFVEENIEIVLVSGVRGTCSDAVTENVKRMAVHLLQQCGDGDAVKGCHKVRRCIEGARATQNLIYRLDLQVRLRVWGPMMTMMKESSSSSSPKTAAVATEVRSEGERNGELHCSVYEADAWDPYRNERHIMDVSNSPSVQSLCDLLRQALRILRRDAEVKGRQFALASCQEAKLLLTTPMPVASIYSDICFSQGTLRGETGDAFSKDPLLRNLLCPTTYTVDMEFLLYERDDASTSGIVAGKWAIHDDAGNTERFDVPLMTLRDRAGLMHQGRCHELLRQETEILDDSAINSLEDAGSFVRTKNVRDPEVVSTLLCSLCSQPLLQVWIFHASCDMLCGKLAPRKAEDFVASCGRVGIDAWLSEWGHPVTVPMVPRCLKYHNPFLFLQECLPLEFGTRAMMPVSVGSLRFGYHLAITAGGRVSTIVGGFSSAATALSTLFPWHVATPKRIPAVVEPTHHGQKTTQTSSNCQAKREEKDTSKPRKASNDQAEAIPSFAVEVIDMEATLRALGVATGKFSQDVVKYSDASGKTLFRFEQMDSLQGIERFVKRLRRSQSPCFASIFVHNNKRASSLLLWRAFAGLVAHKAPHYIKRIRIPIPLVSDEFFSIRFSGLLEMEQKDYALLSILERYSKDPKQWPLKRLSPCFFNLWRLTRGIIEAIRRHDPLFRYTIERASVEVPDNEFVLSFYSGDEKTHETQIKEKRFLQEVRRCFAQYAARWDIEVPSIEAMAFAVMEIRKSLSCSFRAFLTAFLQNSVVFLQNESKASLKLQIVDGVRINLCSAIFSKNEPAREMLSKTFLAEQFPETLPVFHLQQRALTFLSLSTGEGETVFRCHDTTERPGFCWELQKISGGAENVTVLDAAEGPSRFEALTALLEKIAGKSEGEFFCPALGKGKTVVTSLALARTIEDYQEALAQRLGMKKIIHEYDVKRNLLIVRGFHENEGGTGTKEYIIRVISLGKLSSVGDIIHRYYRRELHIADPPLLGDSEQMRIASLEWIYKLCQPYFALPLPPLEKSLIIHPEMKGWKVVLRLPARLFALDSSKYIEYAFWGRGKSEGKRGVLCVFYKAIHGEAPEEVQRVFSQARCGEPFCRNGFSTFTKGLSVAENRNHTVIPEQLQKSSNGGRGIIIAADGENSSVKNGSGTVGIGARSNLGANCMYAELMGLISSQFRPHVGYDGVVECHLSHITGFTGRYVSSPVREGKLVGLFGVPLRATMWLPLQILAVLLSCARRLVPDEELEALLLRNAASWPSLFADAAQSERLFCTTFLRRYLGLCIFEENDLDDRAAVPGTLYLVERTNQIRVDCFEASLSLLQTPLPPSLTTFSKIIASHKAVTISRAESTMWGVVLQQLPRLDAVQAQDFDKAVLQAVMRSANEIAC